jgi:hypothetical protein
VVGLKMSDIRERAVLVMGPAKVRNRVLIIIISGRGQV